MAEKRMFAKSIIDTDAFLSMPLSAQALYFHLCMRADDDGFVSNPRKIQRMISCADDDLKLLIAKRYILVFDSGVIVIKHWRIHNYIRKDTYHETLYLEEKSSLFEKPDGAYTDHPLIDPSRARDELVTDPSTQYRLDKIRLDKGSKDNTSVSPDTDYEQIRQSFIANCPSLPCPNATAKWTAGRKKAIRDKKITDDEFSEVFKRVERSDFLTGRKTGWHCSLDWILKPANWQKINEGNYDNHGPENPGGSKATYDLSEYDQATTSLDLDSLKGEPK